jgi:hypothetical protein
MDIKSIAAVATPPTMRNSERMHAPSFRVWVQAPAPCHFTTIARRENAQAVFDLFGHAQIELHHLFGLALAAAPHLRQGFPEIAFRVFACRRRAMPNFSCNLRAASSALMQRLLCA